MSDTDEMPGITYQANLPLAWSGGDAPSAANLAAWRHANIALLRTLAALEASAADRDHDIDSHLAKALERLETKLDVALNMLAHIAMRDMQMPASCPVVLGARHLEWQSDEPLPAAGASVTLTLYLSPRLPEPLRLFGRVMSSGQGRCVVALPNRDEEFDEWMTRTLFRYHRRGLQARHQG